MRTCVYQAYSQTGDLLYVGQSRKWPTRWAGHAISQTWWRDVATLTIIWFPWHYQATWYEGHLIRTAQPIYNRHIPAPAAIPESLDTQCRLCGTFYHGSFRLPGDTCNDLSLSNGTQPCGGICGMPPVAEGEWASLS